MSNGAHARSFGTVFDDAAEDYDRHRPTYPDVLIDQACSIAGVGTGARVLEVGCGTGQLTRSLLARGLRVTAIEPGDQLIARARDKLQPADDVQFFNATLEDVPPTPTNYRAVFSASAIHWVDPDVSWRKLADSLVDGGTLGLISYFGFEDPRSRDDQAAMRTAMAEIAPELAAEWPTYRDLDGTLAGVAKRRANVSEVWSWLGSYELARPDAAELFHEVQLATVPMLLEHSAEELNGLLGTMSFWARLSAKQREAVAAGNAALQRQLGRSIRSSTVACLVTARRVPRA
jgi:SAM-dependent methyltransferase